MNKQKLNNNISINEFNNSYWYAIELKAYAKKIGYKKVNKFRKDELEKIIENYILTGKLLKIQITKNNNKIQKDYKDSVLTMNTKVINYCSNKITKTFILNEVSKI